MAPTSVRQMKNGLDRSARHSSLQGIDTTSPRPANFGPSAMLYFGLLLLLTTSIVLVRDRVAATKRLTCRPYEESSQEGLTALNVFGNVNGLGSSYFKSYNFAANECLSFRFQRFTYLVSMGEALSRRSVLAVIFDR